MDEQRRSRPGIPLGRVAGVPVSLTVSWLFLAVLLTVVYQAYLAARRPELSGAAGYAAGAGLVLALLLSVLLHELGHALTARRLGIGVRGITLELLGGYTELDRDAPSPRAELAVSLAGPGVSFVLGALAVIVTVALPSGTLAAELAGKLGLGNLIVAVFNVLPGLPLDGGRALRAGIWAVSRDRFLGDRIAGWAGRAVAVASVAVVLLLLVARVVTVFGAALVILVSLTLWAGASQAIRAGRYGPRVPLLEAGRLARPIHPVAPDTPLSEALRQHREAVAAAGDRPPVLGVVNSAGQLLGLVDGTAAAHVPLERQPWVTAQTVARQLQAGRVLPAELSGQRLVDTVLGNPADEYVVAVGEDVVGVLRVADVVELLQSRGRTR